MGLRVLIKGEADLMLAFGAMRGALPEVDTTPSSLSFELIVEPPARIEVFDQQLAGPGPAGLPGSWAPLASTRAADPDIDVVVLSLAGDLTRPLYRQPSGLFVDLATIDNSPEASEALELAAPRFEASAKSVVERLQEGNGKLVVWFTASTVNGQQEPHRWGLDDPPFSVRANRLNLTVARLSQQTGLCFVDADRILAELGAAKHVEGPCHYSEEANLQLFAEFQRIVTELDPLQATSSPRLVEEGQAR